MEHLKAEDLAKRVRTFVVDNFLFGEDRPALRAETSFVESGIIDSTGVLELVGFLEEAFGIEVADDEMTLANLDSIASVARFVARKTGAEPQ